MRSLTQYATDDKGEPIEACKLVDPEVMFPNERFENDHPEVLKAKAVCRGCWFKDQCRQEAMSPLQKYGVWGETTPKERHASARRARRAGTQPETLFGVA
jgi:WhiB family redox-sensing transcriptional regulator